VGCCQRFSAATGCHGRGFVPKIALKNLRIGEIMQPLKVFISSTYLDLKDYRQTAIAVVNRYKCAPLAMEFFLAQPAEPSRAAEKEVRECDVFVGI
jgi:hypothetical protein